MKKLLMLVGLLVTSSVCSADGFYIQLPGINVGIGSTPRYYYQYPQPRIMYEQPVYIDRPIYYERIVPIYTNRNWYGREEYHHHGHGGHRHYDRD